jgi:hypothetical protein
LARRFPYAGDNTFTRRYSMPVILWLLGVPLGLILLFMLVF